MSQSPFRASGAAVSSVILFGGSRAVAKARRYAFQQEPSRYKWGVCARCSQLRLKLLQAKSLVLKHVEGCLQGAESLTKSPCSACVKGGVLCDKRQAANYSMSMARLLRGVPPLFRMNRTRSHHRRIPKGAEGTRREGSRSRLSKENPCKHAARKHKITRHPLLTMMRDQYTCGSTLNWGNVLCNFCQIKNRNPNS